MADQDVTTTGPLFDGRAQSAMTRGTEAVKQKLAAEGMRLATSYLTSSIRHQSTGAAPRAITSTEKSTAYQTGRYSMLVNVDSSSDIVVTTDLATYGPWLEGSGSRNETTRFKGYGSLRRAGDTLESSAGDIASAELERYVEEMN